MFNPKRLELAKKRRKLTAKMLAQQTGITEVTLSRIAKKVNEPDPETIAKIANTLGYPEMFFYEDDYDEVELETVSFRNLKKMSAKVRHAATSGGDLGLMLSGWIDQQFNLPEVDFVDLSYETCPDMAAKALRTHWSLGEKPISHMIRLLESKGVRVFSLSEDSEAVDAFSFWKDNKPFVFLNTFKTAERSVFDAAHELGHLVMHRHGSYDTDRQEVEREADQFASAFLMPHHDILAKAPRHLSSSTIIQAKSRWRVSAMALTHRLHKLDKITDWQYRTLIIELGKKGYRKGEPRGINRETSLIWKQVFSYLWKKKITKQNIADNLLIPLEELESLIFGVLDKPPTVAADSSKINGLTKICSVRKP